jgi:hypothetical protein
MKFLLGLVALFIIPGSVSASWEALLLIANDNELWIPLAFGLAAGIPLYFTLIKKLPAISTFEHELTHALVALLFFRRIHKFIVTNRRGGQVQYSGTFGGEFGDLLIGLAPYFLPTFTLIAVLVRPFLPAGWFPWYDGFIGATLAFHVFSTLEETKAVVDKTKLHRSRRQPEDQIRHREGRIHLRFPGHCGIRVISFGIGAATYRLRVFRYLEFP